MKRFFALFLALILVLSASDMVYARHSYDVLVREQLKESSDKEAIKYSIEKSLNERMAKHQYSKWAESILADAYRRSFFYDEIAINLKENIDRKNFAMLAMKALASEYRVRSYTKIYTDFHDIYGISKPYRDNIANAYYYGITRGKSRTEFVPNDYITRKEAFLMLYRLGEYFISDLSYDEKSPNLVAFKQSDDYKKLPEWARESVFFFISNGILSGYGDGKYGLDDYVSYEQAMAVALSYMDYISQKGIDMMSEDEYASMIAVYKHEKAHPMHRVEYEKKFEILPDVDAKPYIKGKLAKPEREDILNTVNWIRIASGLSEVKLDEDLMDLGQNGAFLMHYTNQYGHHPKQKNAPNELYKKGYKSCSTSNIGMGYLHSFDFILDCADDSDSYNISKVGHRRWLVNPALDMIGGGVSGANDTRFTTQVFSERRSGYKKPRILGFPSASSFPADMLGKAAWSVHFDKSIPGNMENYEVILTRLGDKKEWHFSSVSGEGMYFNVDTGNYGVGPAIIFKADDIVPMPKEKYEVKVLIKGKEKLKYRVNFY